MGIGTAREVVCALKLYDPDFGDPCTEGGEIHLLDEEQLPLTADICLRCHTPPGWMEGHSEPFTPHAPFLKGQFWGAAFLENPVNPDGSPRSVDVCIESEGEMDGIHCDFCHRSQYNYKYERQSRYDATPMVAGNGGFFADRDDTILGVTTSGRVPPSLKTLQPLHRTRERCTPVLHATSMTFL